MKKYIYLSLFCLLSASLIMTSCGDDEIPEEELTLFSTCKYSVVLDGVTIKREQGSIENGLTCNVVSGGSGAGRGFGSSLISNDTDERLGIFRGTINGLDFLEAPSGTQFDSLFSIGKYDFSYNGDQGVSMTYESSSKELWTSYSGIGDQSGSEFELLDKVSGTLLNTFVIKARIKFKCNLYRFDETGSPMTCEGTATISLEAF